MSLALHKKLINGKNQYQSIDISYFQYLVEFSEDSDLFNLKKKELLKKKLLINQF